MDEKKQLLKTLQDYRETYSAGFDAGYHMDQLIKTLQEEIADEE